MPGTRFVINFFSMPSSLVSRPWPLSYTNYYPPPPAFVAFGHHHYHHHQMQTKYRQPPLIAPEDQSQTNFLGNYWKCNCWLQVSHFRYSWTIVLVVPKCWPTNRLVVGEKWQPFLRWSDRNRVIHGESFVVLPARCSFIHINPLWPSLSCYSHVQQQQNACYVAVTHAVDQSGVLISDEWRSVYPRDVKPALFI